MNQILSTSIKKNNSKGTTMDIKKIIAIFCIVIMVFGVVLISMNLYKLYKENKKNIIEKPEVSIEQVDNSIRILVKNEIGMEKITYYWSNSQDKVDIQMNGKTSIEKLIDIPEGENTLTVKAIDINGTENENSKSFINVIDNTDNTKPEINIVVLAGERKITIVAEDETELDYITYKWEDAEEVRLDVTDNNLTKIETSIDIDVGTKRLTIMAVDKANNIKTETKTIVGVTEPEFEVVRYDNKVSIKVSHEKGFKKVTFIINDKTYVYDEKFSGYNSEQTVLDYSAQLQEGQNTITIIAESMEGTERTYKGQCTY